MLTNGEEAETSNRGSFQTPVDAHLLSHRCSEENTALRSGSRNVPFPTGMEKNTFQVFTETRNTFCSPIPTITHLY